MVKVWAGAGGVILVGTLVKGTRREVACPRDICGTSRTIARTMARACFGFILESSLVLNELTVHLPGAALGALSGQKFCVPAGLFLSNPVTNRRSLRTPEPGRRKWCLCYLEYVREQENGRKHGPAAAEY